MKAKNTAHQIKRISSVFLSLAIVLSTLIFCTAVTTSASTDVWNGSIDAEFAGAGTQSDPYRITSAAEFYGFVKNYAMEGAKASDGLYFELTEDIYLNDVSNSNWMNSGAREWCFNNVWTTNAGALGFRGNFDGNGHTVYGMYYENPNDWAAVMGLIPYVSGNAVISNVNIKHAYVKASSYEGRLGGIVGVVNKNSDGSASNVTITKCVADDTVDFKGLTNSFAGGIVGPVRESNVTVTYCGSAVKFNSDSQPAAKGGGIVANSNAWAMKGLTIKNSYSISAFTTGLPGSISIADISDYTFYTAHSWWITAAGLHGVYVAKSNMTGGTAYLTMQNIGWDVWQANDNAYPTIKGSTNYVATENSGNNDIWDGSIAATYAGGTGSVADPYLISTPAQLKRLTVSHIINEIVGGNEVGKYYLLTNDLYLNDVTDYEDWLNELPANNWRDMRLINRQISNAANGFVGHIDGDGHTIYGLCYYETESSLDNNLNLNAGLIFNMGVNSSITDLHIRKSLLNGKYAGAFIGSIGSEAGFASDAGTVTLSGCSVDESVQVYGLKTGGLIGVAQASLIVENCYSSALVAGDVSYGGVYGDAWGGDNANHTFRNVYSTNAYPIALTTSGSVGKIPSEGKRSYENVYSIFTHESNWEGIKSVSSFAEMSDLDSVYWYGTDYKQLINRGKRIFDINADDSEAPDSQDIIALKKSLLSASAYHIVNDCNDDGNVDILDLIRLEKITANFFG